MSAVKLKLLEVLRNLVPTNMVSPFALETSSHTHTYVLWFVLNFGVWFYIAGAVAGEDTEARPSAKNSGDAEEVANVVVPASGGHTSSGQLIIIDENCKSMFDRIPIQTLSISSAGPWSLL